MLQRSTFSKDNALYVIKRKPNVAADSFDAIRDYIKETPAAKDPHTRIIIENDQIYFGHSLQEIGASFPKLSNFMMARLGKSFSEDNIKSYGYKSSDTSFVALHPIEVQQNKLKKEAKAFFSSLPQEEPPLVEKPIGNPQQILLALLEKHDAIAIGEVHSDKSSKKILVDNMATLKANGVDVIYLEHVFYDTQKELFEAYFASDSLKMPIMLENYLNYLDCGFKLIKKGEFSPYSFAGLVIQAKRYGIKIIPIDTVASYSTGSALAMAGGKDGADRCLMMNYVAAEHHQQEKALHNKAIFFEGSKHINAVNSGIPGSSEIIKCPTLVVQDKDGIREECVASQHCAQPDIVIYMKTELSDEAKTLVSEYQSALAQNVADKPTINEQVNNNDSLSTLAEHIADLKRKKDQNLVDFIASLERLHATCTTPTKKTSAPKSLRDQKAEQVILDKTNIFLAFFLDDANTADDKKKTIRVYENAVYPYRRLKTICKCVGLIIVSALCAVTGAAIGLGIGALAGAWTGPGAIVSAFAGMLTGAATGFAITGCYAFLKPPAPLQQAVNDIVQTSKRFCAPMATPLV